jgi:hypothetical protein
MAIADAATIPWLRASEALQIVFLWYLATRRYGAVPFTSLNTTSPGSTYGGLSPEVI